LRNDRDRVTDTAGSDWVSPEHRNLRGPAHYQ